MQEGEAGQEQDVYAPPRAPVGYPRMATVVTEFHVVSLRKFWCLYLATFGLYQYFWLYRHWSQYRDSHRASLWPVARSIFSIFFMHSLNRHVESSLRRSRLEHAWQPGVAATGFVLLSLGSEILGRVTARTDATTLLDYFVIALVLPIGMTMAATQRAANAACRDPDGSANARLTAANWIWMVLGMMLWLLILVGMTLPAE